MRFVFILHENLKIDIFHSRLNNFFYFRFKMLGFFRASYIIIEIYM